VDSSSLITGLKRGSSTGFRWSATGLVVQLQVLATRLLDLAAEVRVLAAQLLAYAAQLTPIVPLTSYGILGQCSLHNH